MELFVVKADGTRQPFNRGKIVATCLRMGATRKEAEQVAQAIEARIHDGIETRKILQMIFRLLQKYEPAVKHQICLRRALSLMAPKPDFERFIQILLREHGYEVHPNRIIRGRCVEHEVDAVATKNRATIIVEVKHHYKFHTPTGLDVSRIAQAVFEDVTEGGKLELNDLKIDGAMIVCNTKLSAHAQRYAQCKGIQYIGWKTPRKHGLRDLIEATKLYPLTYLRGVNKTTREKLAFTGIVTLKQLVRKNLEIVGRETGIPKKTLEAMTKKAETILARQ